MSQHLINFEPVKQQAIGGGLEGAERTSRETFNWQPAVISPDRQINPVKEEADARVRDSVQNDGYMMGATYSHRDGIVGSQYMLNAQPDLDVLGADEGWADEFQQAVEARFNLVADSQENWFDAAAKNTFTGLVRLAVGGYLMTGEVLATAEWMRSQSRPFRTAIQMVSPSRLSNPDGVSDTRFLRRGVERNLYGESLSYWIRTGHPADLYDFGDLPRWVNVPARKPWGRRQVLHIVEQLQPDQTRGVADMVAALKHNRMTKKFREVTLQNAVVNASYAAAIESELPREVVFGAMGAGQAGFAETLSQYMGALQQYAGAAENIAIDGVKIPHLFPGTKFSLKPMGTPGGIGTDFEKSLMRNIAAVLGLSYEEFSRDFSDTNYSSARAAMGNTQKFFNGRKKAVADAFATMIFTLWLEEEMNAGNIPFPPGKTLDSFYDPVLREAYISCSWIGASRGQIDELKETQAAIMRIKSGLSTYEQECATLGRDFRKVFRQRWRETKLQDKYELQFDMDAKKAGKNDAQQTMTDDSESGNEDGGKRRERQGK